MVWRHDGVPVTTATTTAQTVLAGWLAGSLAEVLRCLVGVGAIHRSFIIQDEIVEIVRKDKCDGTTRDLSKIDKYLELVEYIYDKLMKQNVDEEKAKQRKQRYSAKPEATAYTNNLNGGPGGGQNSRNEKGNPPTGPKKFKELTDAVLGQDLC